VPYVLEDVKIRGNFASNNGGGLYVENIKALSLTGSTSISENEAMRGGGIYFECLDQYQNCDLNLYEGISIDNNFAFE
jgi:predicted outer membrane repeat protein